MRMATCTLVVLLTAALARCTQPPTLIPTAQPVPVTRTLPPTWTPTPTVRPPTSTPTPERQSPTRTPTPTRRLPDWTTNPAPTAIPLPYQLTAQDLEAIALQPDEVADDFTRIEIEEKRSDYFKISMYSRYSGSAVRGLTNVIHVSAPGMVEMDFLIAASERRAHNPVATPPIGDECEVRYVIHRVEGRLVREVNVVWRHRNVIGILLFFSEYEIQYQDLIEMADRIQDRLERFAR